MKDERKTITYRDNRDVINLFEQLVDYDDRSKSQIIRSLMRDYVEEKGVDEDAKKSIIRDLEDRIREKERELDELKRKKERFEELSEEVDLEENSQKQQKQEKEKSSTHPRSGPEIHFKPPEERGDDDE